MTEFTIKLTPEQCLELKLGRSIPIDIVANFLKAMAKGSKIDAIKELRTITGCGVVDGKNFVEANAKYFKELALTLI